jgi:hypothetical protein
VPFAAEPEPVPSPSPEPVFKKPKTKKKSKKEALAPEPEQTTPVLRKRKMSNVSNATLEKPQPKKAPKKKSVVIEEAPKLNGVEKNIAKQVGRVNPRIHINPEDFENLNKRVKISHMGQVNLGISDNSFATKLATGGVDEYGKFGQRMLGGIQGKDFRKQKDKLKRKDFAGETIGAWRDNSFLLD